MFEHDLVAQTCTEIVVQSVFDDLNENFGL